MTRRHLSGHFASRLFQRGGQVDHQVHDLKVSVRVQPHKNIEERCAFCARERRSVRLEIPDDEAVIHRSGAGLAGVARGASHLRRRFKAAFGRTPRAYLVRVRMEEAAKLLKAGHLSIKEVAKSVGYGDANNFSTAFKRFYGNTPQSFRRTSDSL